MPAARRIARYFIIQKVLLTPKLTDKYNKEDVRRHGNDVPFKSRVRTFQLEYATDDDHMQDNSIPCVPVVLSQPANSYFK
jgi:hypothetical protein